MNSTRSGEGPLTASELAGWTKAVSGVSNWVTIGWNAANGASIKGASIMAHPRALSFIRLPLILAGVALAGCVDTAVDASARQSAARSRPTPRAGVSPHGASVALASLEGAPEAVAERFKQALSSAADGRDIAFAAPETAQYRIRGYLTAAPAQEGTRYSCVWDVFDRQGRRAQRLTDEVTAKSSGWDALDDKTLFEVARHGAEDLAAFLTTTPEAIEAAGESGVTAVAVERASDPAPARPLGFAEAK